ncbi:nSTAND1 domain-containing NTPase [Streptomyces olivochromogenes]|uniref:nSTAND1 domain-containing NTPase n=1 Tax=Streptomyces olivochromogenes TaxID=1963 RepID=UPI0036B0407A
MGRREKPLDPAQGAAARFAFELRGLRDEAGAPTYRAMARRAGYSGPTLSAAAAGEKLPTLPVLLAYVSACGGDPSVWERRWRAALADEAGTPAPDDAEGPYPGLARFEPADRDRFHGRDDLIAELLRLVGRRRVSAVVGASGSGKSSLLRAGLIPALRASTGARAAQPAAAMRTRASLPGQRRPPVAEFGSTATEPAPSAVPSPLSATHPPAPAAIRILTPGAHPARTHDALFVPHDAPGDTLLVVDQFEELFALCADPGERALFIERLLTALDPDSGLRVIIGVRADFYGRCAEHGPLAEALRDSTLLVGPMTPQRLREAVVRPAAARRVVVERALTARIVADVADEPGGLPLMAHALREIWRRRTARTLSLTAYEAIGGVQGAVAHTAEEVYAHCTPVEAAAVRALLLRLVNPGDGAEDTRRPVHRDELGEADTTARVLEQLVRARLLTVDGDSVDLAHEALISAWPRLRGWVDEDRERLRLHRRLTEAARTWQQLDRDAGALYRGVRLTAAREEFGSAQGELRTLERDFLAASVAAYESGVRAAARAARRLRSLTVSLAVLLCLAVVAGVAAWRQSGVSARQRDEAEARRVAAFADTLRPTDPRTAMRLALAAWRTADLPETREAVRTAAAQSDLAAFTQPAQVRALNAPYWLSADGRIYTTVVRGKVVQWDVRRQRQLREVALPGLSEGITDVSADARWIAYRGRDGATVTNLSHGESHRIAPGPWTDTDGAFGPSGRTFVVRREGRGTGDERAMVEVWDVRRERVLFRYPGGDPDGPPPVLSPNDRFLAWCTHDGEQLRVWDVVERRRVVTDPPARTQRLLCRSDELIFTPDNRALAAGTADGVVTWDFHADRGRPLLPMPGEGVNSVEFDPTGAYALSRGSADLALWRTDSPAPADGGPRRPLITFPVETPAVTDIRLDPREGVLRYREGSRAGVVRTLSLHGLISTAWRKQARTDAAFDADGQPAEPAVRPAVRAVAADGTVHTAVGTRDGIRVTRQGAHPVSHVVGGRSEGPAAIDPAGRTVVTAEGVLIDVETGGRRRGFEGEDLLRTAVFSPDGRFLAAADIQGRLTLWDAGAQHRIAVLAVADSTVERPALAFSADGSLLAASRDDGSVHVWETASPRLAGATLPTGDGPVLAIGLTPGARELNIATAHLPLRSAELTPDRAAADVCARAEGGATRAEWRRHLPDVPYRQTC